MPFASINDIELFYDEQNPNDQEKSLIFLHGAGGNHLSWWQQIPHFRESYRCISIDHRGFGRSIDPSEIGNQRFVDDLEALLDYLKIERTNLIAQSMGGRSALGFSVRQPERVDNLVMADTWGFFSWPKLSEQITELQTTQVESEAPLTTRALGKTFRDENPAEWFLYRQIFDLNPPRAIQKANPDAPTQIEVSQLEIPTLFLVGSDDLITPPKIIKQVHEIVQGSKFEVVPGCGHSVYFEAPALFNHIVGDFLSK